MKKLLVVIGATGTGKTKLAAQLASALSGEVLNCDAMQLYRGLPIATNKATAEEQMGVAHHLIDVLDPESEMNVVGYREMALKQIQSVQSQSKVAVLCGGTHYYIQALVWKSLSDELEAKTKGDAALKAEDAAQLDLLENEPNGLYQKLQTLDPLMANKLHPNNTRKIRRSLEICLTTGRPHSELLDSQEEEARFDALFFWVDAQRNILDARCNARVDNMVKRGLIEEVRDAYHSFRPSSSQKGIWQSIGFKELLPFYEKEAETTATPEELAALKEQCIEEMKMNTRRYTRKQITWISHRLLERSDSPKVFRFDTSDETKWQNDVFEPALQVAKAFLEDRELPLDHLVKSESTKKKVDFQKYYCEKCKFQVFGANEWETHKKSRKHRKSMRPAHKRQRKETTDEGNPLSAAAAAVDNNSNDDFESVSSSESESEKN